MNNCLITQLNGAADNDSLTKLGDSYFKVIKNTSAEEICQSLLFMPATGKSITITATDNGYFATTLEGLDDPQSRLTTITIYDNTQLFFVNEDYTVVINSKYNLRNILVEKTDVPIIFEFDLSQFEYCSELRVLSLRKVHVIGDFENLKNSPYLGTLNLSYTNVKGSIDCLKDNLSLIEDFEVNFNYHNSNITGNLETFKNSTHLNTLFVLNTNIEGNTTSLTNCTSLTLVYFPPLAVGTIEDLIKGQVLNGRTSSTNGIRMSAPSTVTFNGDRISGIKFIKWTSDSNTVTITDGTQTVTVPLTD